MSTVATVQGAQTLNIYKEDLLRVWTGWGVSIISSNRGSKCESMVTYVLGPWEHISDWSYTLMRRSQCWRCWNLLYIHKEDLLRVWTGCGVSIISSNRGSKCGSMHNFHIFVPMHQYAVVEALIHLRLHQTSILHINKEFLQGLVWGRGHMPS